ncbi:MAG: hypothetical protein ACJ798_00860 [Phenylobacterium sp.]
MSEAIKILQFIRELNVNPLAAVIATAVVGAWLEQTYARKKTPNFTKAHQGATLRDGAM